MSTATVSGVVYLDDVPLGGVQVCDEAGRGCSVAAADGSFTVTVPAPSDGDLWEACLGAWATSSEQQGLWAPFGPRQHSNRCNYPTGARAGDVVTGKEIHLHSFALASGQVVNQAGTPIAGATVDSNVSTKALTDSNGRFSVRLGHYSYDDGHLSISAPGYESTHARFGNSGEVGRIVMAKAGDDTRYSISGIVTDVAGQPAVGAKVCVVGGSCLGATDAKGAYFGLLANHTEQVVSWKLRITSADGRAQIEETIWSAPLSNYSTLVNFQLPKAGKPVVVNPKVIVGAKPVIVGKAKVGVRLQVVRGKWAPVPVTTRVQWYANGQKIKGATSSGLKLTKKLVGKRITVKVTGSKAGYPTVVKVSKATVKVRR